MDDYDKAVERALETSDDPQAYLRYLLGEAAKDHDYSHVKISTTCICPPIPTRNFDWSAIDDSSYDGEGSLIGRGPTEADAVVDLVEQIAARDDTDPFQVFLEIVHSTLERQTEKEN